jgi:hypothetical protein
VTLARRQAFPPEEALEDVEEGEARCPSRRRVRVRAAELLQGLAALEVRPTPDPTPR